MSVINYYVGVINIEPEEFVKIDNEVRNILTKHKLHFKPSCKERLYLSRDQLGRGLCNIEHKSEIMLFKLFNALSEFKEISTRRGAILETQNHNKTHLSTIIPFLCIKYSVPSINSSENLAEIQIKKLYSEINSKINHKKLYNFTNNELASIKESSKWLKKGNIKAQEEAAFALLQDRNIFCGNIEKCPHCKNSSKSVDHLATKCDRMVGHDYTRRHNEVVRCIHLHLCNKYSIKNSKKMKTHSVQEIVANKQVENNRPDIFVFDKIKNEIMLIEVGITNQDIINTVENEKRRKYDLLANELSLMYKCNVKVIPYVMTWDGVVSTYHKKYSNEIGIPEIVEAYIQTRVLKKTLESISFDRRRGHGEDDSRGMEIEKVLKNLGSFQAERKSA